VKSIGKEIGLQIVAKKELVKAVKQFQSEFRDPMCDKVVKQNTPTLKMWTEELKQSGITGFEESEWIKDMLSNLYNPI